MGQNDPPQTIPPASRRLIRPLILSVIIAIALYALFLALGEARMVADSMTRLGGGDWLLVLGLSLINYLLRFVRWQFYFQRQGFRLPIRANFAYYMAGFAFTTTPAKAGEAIRTWYLRERHGVGYAHSFAALFADRLMDVAAVVLMALSGALTFPDYRWPVLAIALLLLVALPLVHSPRLHRLIEQVAARTPWQRLTQLAGHLVSMLKSAALLLRTGNLYIGLGLSLLSWLAEGIGFWWICQALGLELAPLTAIGIYAVGMLAGAASMIPGGLGSTEAVMGLMLVSLGVAMPAAVAATLLCRIATLWFAVLLGFVALGRLGLTSPANSGAQPPHEPHDTTR